MSGTFAGAENVAFICAFCEVCGYASCRNCPKPNQSDGGS